jgi:hypothetical protein
MQGPASSGLPLLWYVPNFLSRILFSNYYVLHRLFLPQQANRVVEHDVELKMSNDTDKYSSKLWPRPDIVLNHWHTKIQSQRHKIKSAASKNSTCQTKYPISYVRNFQVSLFGFQLDIGAYQFCCQHDK